MVISRDNTMVISLAPRKHSYSPYFPFYTFVCLIAPRKFLSSIRSFFKKSMTADYCRSDILSRFKIMVIKFPFNLFYVLSTCRSESESEKIRREVLD